MRKIWVMWHSHMDHDTYREEKFKCEVNRHAIKDTDQS